MLAFPPGSLPLALAGLAAAAAPIVIHILNRQRFRVLDWAAMDFLLEAASRSRSLLQLRDVLLLLLRTAAVVLFGLAIARPFLASGAGAAGGGPVHAIVVLDNSLSMGREKLGGDKTLLDDARARAQQFIERLPPGSRTSVIPLCGPAGTFSFDGRRSAEDTKEALDSITVVDRPGSAAAAVDLAARAAQLAADLPDKRVVFIGDQQSVTWPAGAGSLLAKEAGAGGEGLKFDGMQVVQVAADSVDNTWVESLRVEDGVADLNAPAIFTAVIRHEGAAPRSGVRVSLAVDGDQVAGSTIDLEPGQTREVSFTHEFHAVPAEGRPGFAPATVTLPPDRVPGDDTRSVVAPVLASVPVVFVDQTGAGEENPRLNRFGETRHLRRLLAPLVAGEELRRNLVQVRHLKIDALDREALADVRLVVVAGVPEPGPAVTLLREFVAQGGRLVIAAGADFDPAAWNATGWLEGRGILPVPLAGPIGQLPESATGDIKPFFLDWKTMKDEPLFRLPGTPEEELADLYESPVFFQAVACEADAAKVAQIAAADVAWAAEEQAERSRLTAEVARLSDLESRGRATPTDREALRQAREDLEAVAPTWLSWAAASESEAAPKPQGPRVLAAFDNGLPFLVSRQIGRGEVVCVTSGLFSPWNTLPKTNAILLFDRLLRSLLATTLPDLNVATADQFTIPLGSADRRADIRLVRPGERQESLAVEALGGDAYGVTIRDMTARGVYTIVASKADLADRERRDMVLWDRPWAANGEPRESEPGVLNAASFAAKTDDSDAFRWVERDAPISIDGASVSGQGSWWWLLLAAIGCLVAENALLARMNALAAEGASA
ncbi:MAG: VWA domain-containing protein [Planctomycetes bacterium]|nr:VWA domain-containing protein [Planctomycetota bacterium]